MKNRKTGIFRLEQMDGIIQSLKIISPNTARACLELLNFLLWQRMRFV